MEQRIASCTEATYRVKELLDRNPNDPATKVALDNARHGQRWAIDELNEHCEQHHCKA